MARTPTPIETVKASEARQHFSELVDRVHSTDANIVIEKSGIPVAVLISPAEFAAFRPWNELRKDRHAVLDRFQASFAGIPEDSLEREIEKAIEEVRSERRAERKIAAESRS